MWLWLIALRFKNNMWLCFINKHLLFIFGTQKKKKIAIYSSYGFLNAIQMDVGDMFI